MTPYLYDVFLSYSRADAPWAERLEADLQRLGFRVFFDQTRVTAGESWERELALSLKRSRNLVVIWSDNARGSDWVTRELWTFDANRYQSGETPDPERRLILMTLLGQNAALSSVQRIDDLRDAVSAGADAHTVDDAVWNRVVAKVANALKASAPREAPTATLRRKARAPFAVLLASAGLAALFLAPGVFRREGGAVLATFQDSLAALGSRETPAQERRDLFLALSARSSDLRGADLSGLDLSQQVLVGLDLSKADLSGARLTHTRFDNAVLTGASLTNADLRGASLKGVDLTNANVRGTLLDGVDLRDANLTGVNLDSALTTALTILQDGTPGPYRVGEDAARSTARSAAEADILQRGFIWIGNYDANRQAWEKPRLAGTSLRPVTKAPNQIQPREQYRALGDMALRINLPANDEAYFEAVPVLAFVPENSTVSILDTPVAFDRTRFERDGRVQYWVRIRVDTIPQFMYVHYQDPADSDLARHVADAFRTRGYSIRLVANRPNARNTAVENVRYFRMADRTRANEVAAVLQQVLQDNGVQGFSPRTSDRSRTAPSAARGQIEIWLPPLQRQRT